MSAPRDHNDLDQHVRFAGELARWIRKAGVSDDEAIGDLAVGMADIVSAAAGAAIELEELLKLDPTTPAGADAAFDRLVSLRAMFVTEILAHAQDLERRWEALETPITERIPDDEE